MVLVSLSQISSAQLAIPEASTEPATYYARITSALTDDSPWIRAHAAEALIALKHPEIARNAFESLSETNEPKYRIVVWRILAAATSDPERRKMYLDRIRKALFDPTGIEQAHAMEALAKLDEPFATDAERRQVLGVADAAGPASPFAVWRLSQAGNTTAMDRLIKLLRSGDVTTRARTAYVLSHLHPLPAVATKAISNALKAEPAESPAYSLLKVALGGEAVRQLIQDAHTLPSGRYFAALSLAEFGTLRDRDILLLLIHDPDHDVQVAASFALLRLKSSATTVPALGRK